MSNSVVSLRSTKWQIYEHIIKKNTYDQETKELNIFYERPLEDEFHEAKI
jgi:hypothetical protein